jgi:hypothetical protein
MDLINKPSKCLGVAVHLQCLGTYQAVGDKIFETKIKILSTSITGRYALIINTFEI